MGQQQKMSECRGWQAKLKQRNKTVAGRLRDIGWATQRTEEKRVMLSGATTHYSIDRKAIHIPRPARPDVEPDGREGVLNRRAAGSAFGWWTSQSSAEKDATIARLIAANDSLVTKMKKSEAAKKRKAHEAMHAANKKKQSPS